MKKNILRLSAIISSFALAFSLCACTGNNKPGDEQIDVTIAEENPVEENTTENDIVEAPEEEIEEEVEEEKIVLSLPDKYLAQLGLDSKFNDWMNTERNVDNFIEIYGMPDNGDEGVYYYTNYSVFYDTETRLVYKLGLSPNVLLSIASMDNRKTPDIYNPFDFPSNLTTLKPLMDIGYFEIQNVDYGGTQKNVESIVRPTMDLKISSSQEAFDEKYKTIFDLENDLGEAYLSENYHDEATYSTCIDFTNNSYYVIWHNTIYSEKEPDRRHERIIKLIATVSLEDNSIIDLSRVFDLNGRIRCDDNLSTEKANKRNIEY